MTAQLDGDSFAPEYFETRSTALVIGRPMVDAVKFETCIAVSNHASGRDFHVNLRVADEIVELNPFRAAIAADLLQRVVDDIRAKAAVVTELAANEDSTKALLDGRARTVAV